MGYTKYEKIDTAGSGEPDGSELSRSGEEFTVKVVFILIIPKGFREVEEGAHGGFGEGTKLWLIGLLINAEGRGLGGES